MSTRRKTLLALILAPALLAGCATAAPSPTPPAPTVTPLPPLDGSGGGRIVYASYLGSGTGELYAMNADGSAARRLTFNVAEDNQPVWSPDGKRIAFHSNRQGSFGIYASDAADASQAGAGAAGSELSAQRLTSKLSNTTPAWSPDGSRIAFVSGSQNNSEICVLNVQEALSGVDGADQQRLTQNRAADGQPAWSPDGRQIAFTSDRDGKLAIYIMHADGSGQQRLIQSDGEMDDAPAWSPDGSRIAFSSARAGHWRICIANANGTDVQCLSPVRSDVDEYAPGWSPDGTRMAFQSNVDGQWDIYVMNEDGTQRLRLTTSLENDYEPSWGPGEVAAPAMVLVEAGSFEMGSASGQADERPVHTVRLTRSFYMARYAVTFEEYDRFCEDEQSTKPDDGGRGRGNLPVINLDWYAATKYCNWLSEQQGLTPCYSGPGRVPECDFLANGYRLATEAEWEYAARGGNQSRGFTYAGSDNLGEVAWYAANSGDKIHPVGQKKPNELGLYDMSGNLYEWCWDWYREDYYASSPSDDPTGPPPEPSTSARGPNKVRRSGSWREDADSLRTTCRSFDYASYVGDNGFRVVRTK